MSSTADELLVQEREAAHHLAVGLEQQLDVRGGGADAALVGIGSERRRRVEVVAGTAVQRTIELVDHEQLSEVDPRGRTLGLLDQPGTRGRVADGHHLLAVVHALQVAPQSALGRTGCACRG